MRRNIQVFFLLLLVLTLLVLVSGFVSAGNPGIYCDGDSNIHYPGTYLPNFICTVTKAPNSQTYNQLIVDVADPTTSSGLINGEPAVKNWTFKELIIPKDFELYFENSFGLLTSTFYENNAGSPGINGGGAKGDGFGGAGGTDIFHDDDHRNGGAGGHGGNKQQGVDGFKGGGAGGGGAGGIIFQQGGDGARGGTGKQSGNWGDGGAGSESPFAGANIRLILRNLKIEQNAVLSVSGMNGSTDCSYRNGESANKGGGAGGGAGGSGAGRLVIYTTTAAYESGAAITANGGVGGSGCKGGDDTSNDDKSGGGGGAGAGGDGGELYIYYQGTTLPQTPEPEIYEAKEGTQGVAGKGGKKDNKATPAEDGYPAQDGQAGTAHPPVLVKEYDPNGTNSFDSSFCTDGIDNDFDGYIDFEDADCFNSAKDENGWDNDGPIPGGISLPGIHSYDAYKEWDPLSLNASDGICGDDVEECINKYDCSDIVYDPSHNVYASNCTAAGCGVDYLDGWCTGEDFCSDLSKSACENPSLNCLWYDNTTGNFTCSGNLKNICAGFNTNLNSCDAHLACKSKQGLGLTDQSYVATTNSDLKRYYCSEDNNYNQANDINFVKIPANNSHEWKWWDAYQQGTSFTIHNYDGIDYIANGQEWFYCNANQSNIHEKGSNAIHVAEGENFSSAVINGGYTCVEGLTAAGKYFDDVGYKETDGWNGYFDYCKGQKDTFCCELTNSNGAVPGYSLTEDGFKSSLSSSADCGYYCYYNDSKNNGESRTQISSISNTNDLVNDYCAVYTFDPSCTEDKIPLFGQDKPTGYIEKRSCGFDLSGCLTKTLALDKNCTDISINRTKDGEIKTFGGTRCSNTQYCGGTQEYLLSYDTVPENMGYDKDRPICCLGEDDASTNICMDFEPPLTEGSCQEAGGDYLNETAMGNYQCEGGVIYGQYCCLGGEWVPQWNKLVLKDLAQPDSFICYDHQQDNRFAECCTDFTKCFNSEKNSFFSDNNDLNHGYYGKGGVLHTLRNFDSYQKDATTGSKLLIDFIRVEQLNNADQHMFIDLDSSKLTYKINNWTGFEYLEFDIAYNLERVNYVELEDGQGTIIQFNLTNYLTNGKKVMRWHHAVLPLANLAKHFNLSDVEKIRFKSDYSGDNLYVGVDAFFLSENSSQRNFTDNYYCTGNFGSWIENLDGSTDKGFNKSNSDINDFGKYWYACEAQASFDWTGHLCCGDDTRNGHYSTSNAAEYFSDSSAGCFHGNTVPSDTTVGYVLNDAAYNNLIFYKGSFFACMADIYQKNVSYTSSGPVGNAPHLVNKTMDEFSVIGDYICNDYTWMSLSSVSRSRIIASKMYNLTFTNEKQLQNFSIYCDNITKVSPNAAKGAKDTLGSSIQDFCTLQYFDDQGSEYPERILIGLSLDSDTDIETFLENFYNYLRTVNAITEGDTYKNQLTNACKDAQGQAGFNNETNFFQKCDHVENIHLRYNPDFKILFVGYNLNPTQDFNGLFKQDATVIDYLRSFWDAFIGLFSSWFGGGNQAGKQINWTNQTILPLFSGDGPVTAQNIVQLNKVYISARGTKEIRGFTEQRYATANTKSTADNYTIMEYIGFNNSVQFLAKRYYGTANYYQDPYELNYFVGNDTQFILLVNANKSADVPFEPDFDWRRLGPMLQFNTTPAQHHFQAEAGNGIVDYGEWCDGNAFKFNNNTCAFWNETHIYCHVYCNGNNLDQSYCLNDSEATCDSPLPN